MDRQDGFEFYEPSSIDPGHWILFGTIISTVLLLVVLPFALRVSRQRHRKASSLGLFMDDGQPQQESNVIDDTPSGIPRSKGSKVKR